MRKRNKLKIHTGLAITLAILMSFIGISGGFVTAASEDGGTRVPVYKNLEELSGKRVGVQVGSVFDKIVEDSGEDLSYKLLTANTESIDYSYDEAEGSTIIMKLR